MYDTESWDDYVDDSYINNMILDYNITNKLNKIDAQIESAKIRRKAAILKLAQEVVKEI